MSRKGTKLEITNTKFRIDFELIFSHEVQPHKKGGRAQTQRY